MVDSNMKRLLVLMGLVLMIVSLWGCAAHRGSAVLVERPRTLTKEDVVNMATSDIGDEVIIAQIEATESQFSLSVSDVTELKKAGVSENVIEYMISTGKEGDGKVQYLRYAYHPYYPMYTYYPSVRAVYVNGSRWYYSPRRGGRAGVWIRVRRR
jgi:trehalose utilization protein